MNIQATPSVRHDRPQASLADPSPKADGPDLVVDRFDPSTGFPYPGDRIDFSVIVRNGGNQAAGPFNVEVSGDNMRPEQRRLPGLAAGASARLSFGPANVGHGFAAWYDAEVDTANEVQERREDNNWAKTSVSVRDPFPPRDPFPRPPGRPFP